MAITYRTTGVWGVGKGSSLTSVEGDTNFWELYDAIQDLIASPPAPNEIVSAAVVGDQLTFTMEDASEIGPVTLPIAELEFRGTWLISTEYFRGNLVRVVDGVNDGIYYVNTNHTSASGSFDPDAGDINGPYYSFLFTSPSVTVVPWFASGVPGEGIDSAEPMFAWVAPYPCAVPEDLAGTFVRLIQSAFLEADMELTLYVDAADIGTITIGSGAVTAYVPASVVNNVLRTEVAAGSVVWLSPPVNAVMSDSVSESDSEPGNSARNLAITLLLEFPPSEVASSSA